MATQQELLNILKIASAYILDKTVKICFNNGTVTEKAFALLTPLEKTKVIQIDQTKNPFLPYPTFTATFMDGRKESKNANGAPKEWTDSLSGETYRLMIMNDFNPVIVDAMTNVQISEAVQSVKDIFILLWPFNNQEKIMNSFYESNYYARQARYIQEKILNKLSAGRLAEYSEYTRMISASRSGGGLLGGVSDFIGSAITQIASNPLNVVAPQVQAVQYQIEHPVETAVVTAVVLAAAASGGALAPSGSAVIDGVIGAGVQAGTAIASGAGAAVLNEAKRTILDDLQGEKTPPSAVPSATAQPAPVAKAKPNDFLFGSVLTTALTILLKKGT